MKNVITDDKSINEVLNRGTIVEVLPSLPDFRKVLKSGKTLRFYIGFDATAPTLHLSHAKNVMLMEKFRKLGHEVIILFGDFTARIGDPTGESSARKQLSREEVVGNVEKWKQLIKPLMSFDAKENPPKIMYNHEWLSKLTLEELIGLSGNFTIKQIIERDMFQKRMQEDKPIYLNEFLYPLMQGYDSVAMNVDVEVCGTDQTFNAMAGRVLQKRLNNKEKFVVAVTLMANPKTGELMSKSKGTGVFLHVSPNEMYGQIMSQPDEMLELLYINNTYLSLDEIKEILNNFLPRDSKMRLAYEITKIFHGEELAKKAELNFVNVFQKKNAPESIPEVIVSDPKIDTLDLLLKTKLAKSKGDAKRLIAQKGVKLNGKVIEESEEIHITKEGLLLQKGKKDFIKVLLG